MPGERTPPPRQSLATWAPLLVLTAVGVVFYGSGAWRHLSLDTLQAHRAALHHVVETHTGLALLGFVGAYAVFVLLSIPGATVMTLAGGLLFGAWTGAVATLVAATLGATGVYLLARSSIGSHLVRRAQSRAGRLQRVVDAFHRDAFFYLLSLRLTPVLPFWLVNILAGAGRAPLMAFLGATFIGMAPATIIYSLVGAGLERALAEGRPPGVARLLDPALLLPLLGLALLSLVPVLLRRFVPNFRGSPHA